jgi:hypothetical protein
MCEEELLREVTDPRNVNAWECLLIHQLEDPGVGTNKIKSVQPCKITSTVISCSHYLAFILKNSDDDIVDAEIIINFK